MGRPRPVVVCRKATFLPRACRKVAFLALPPARLIVRPRRAGGSPTLPRMRAMRVLRLIVHARTREPVAVLAETDGSRRVPGLPAQAAGRRDRARPPGRVPRVLPRRTCCCPCCAGSGTTSTASRSPRSPTGCSPRSWSATAAPRVPVLPSDALAVAVRERLPIGMAEEILDEVGQPVGEVFPDGVGGAAGGAGARDSGGFLDDVSAERLRRPAPPRVAAPDVSERGVRCTSMRRKPLSLRIATAGGGGAAQALRAALQDQLTHALRRRPDPWSPS